MENIVIEEKHSKTVRLSVSGIVMVLLSAAICYMGITESSVLFTFIGICGTVFFAFCTVYLISRTVKTKALLTIKTDGIEDTSSASSVGFIPYQEIRQFEIINLFGQRMIGVHLKNEEQFINRLTPMRQKAARSNLKMKFPPIAIRVETAKDMTIEDILSLLQKRLADCSCFYSD